MSRLFGRSARYPPRPPLPDAQRQRLDGWIAMLDVDLESAQAILRLPPAQWPLPPIALPACGSAPAVEAPTPDEPPEPPPAPSRAPLGAYARRARKG